MTGVLSLNAIQFYKREIDECALRYDTAVPSTMKTHYERFTKLPQMWVCPDLPRWNIADVPRMRS